MTPVVLDNDHDELTDRFGDNLRVALARRRISARELGRRLGVSHSWVSLRTTGAQSPTLRDVQAIADELEMTTAGLLGFEQQSPSRPEIRDLEEAVADPRLPRTAFDIIMGLIGQAVAVAIMATPRRKALPSVPVEPKMTERKATPRKRAS